VIHYNYRKMIGILFLLLLLSLTACTNKPIGGNDEIPIESDTVKEEKNEDDNHIIELVTLQYPPYEYEEDGEIKGIAVEIIREGFSRLGYDVSITLYPWTRALNMVKNGDADGIFTAYKTDERLEFADYSNEVLIQQSVSLFVIQGSNIKFDGDLDNVRKYSFGVVRDVSYGEKFDTMFKNNEFAYEETNTGESNLQKLINGRFDILISNTFGALSIIKKEHISDQVIELKPVVESVPSYIAFSKKRNLTDLRDEFDEILIVMKNDGTIDRIIDAYTK